MVHKIHLKKQLWNGDFSVCLIKTHVELCYKKFAKQFALAKNIKQENMKRKKNDSHAFPQGLSMMDSETRRFFSLVLFKNKNFKAFFFSDILIVTWN